ncbi:DUF4234 domain-containing protein [Diaminobutyricibacter sp. McL0608]|uniref:DUF4234 domain-containing protein n=1 Tax=Leifsonia sp. McL0608 TaxID=3143537 RepID=UPI0031F3051D
MKRRSPAAVFFLPFLTLGIYWIVWLATTRGELTTRDARIPTTWFYILPIVNIWWLWKFSAGIAHITGRSTLAPFALLFLLGNIGATFVQAGLNGVKEPYFPAIGDLHYSSVIA